VTSVGILSQSHSQKEFERNFSLMFEDVKEFLCVFVHEKKKQLQKSKMPMQLLKQVLLAVSK
jgi:hypothetical protein